jgi:2-oxoglutarate ferredoxin oxidoreductase subunit beta
VLQPCPTYNDINTKAWYGGEDRKDPAGRPVPRYYDLEKAGHDPKIGEGMSEDEVDRKTLKVIELSKEWGDRVPIGVFYQNETVPTYQDRIVGRISSYVERPPAKQQIGTKSGESNVDLSDLSRELLVETRTPKMK